MSDDEAERPRRAVRLAAAGGSAFETFLVVGFLVFVTLLITDILGFTKVFSFTGRPSDPPLSTAPAVSPAALTRACSLGSGCATPAAAGPDGEDHLAAG